MESGPKRFLRKSVEQITETLACGFFGGRRRLLGEDGAEKRKSQNGQAAERVHGGVRRTKLGSGKAKAGWRRAATLCRTQTIDNVSGEPWQEKETKRKSKRAVGLSD